MPLAVCATPIGNLDDVTLRVLRELEEAELLLCEDTRHTRALLSRHGIRAPRLLSYHRHNEAARSEEVLPLLIVGTRVALVSDAGLPGIGDPGTRLVDAALEAGVPVSVLPGPSAVETALVAGGLGGDSGYRFLGWLPRREPERRRLWDALASERWPAVGFDSPQRAAATLRSLADVLPARRVAVCRELTKAFEEVVRGTALEVADRLASGIRGEVTIVIDGAPNASRAGGADLAEAQEAVAELMAAGVSRSRAARLVARLTGVPRRALYEAAK